MTEARRTLWRLNQEYAQRLARVRHYVYFLTNLLAAREQEYDGLYLAHLNAVLEYLNATLTSCYEEHRAWRYRYFYESAGEKRMAQDEAGVFRAIAQFSRLRDRQSRPIHEARLALAGSQRPPLDFTQIPQGDLWELTLQALRDFAELDTALSS